MEIGVVNFLGPIIETSKPKIRWNQFQFRGAIDLNRLRVAALNVAILSSGS
jgi:hypothetical protein